MRFLAFLLASVSLAAVTSAAAPALAQDSGFTVEATGGYVWGPNTGFVNYVGPASGTTATSSDLSGYYASLRIGKELSPSWDVKAGIAVTHVSGSGNYTIPAEVVFSDKIGSVSDETAFQTLDVEVGYTPQLADGLNLRFFGGLRGMHFTNSLTDTSDYTIFPPITPSPDAVSDTYTDASEFYGVGPRAGIEIEKRLGDGPFGVSASGSGSVIFGSERSSSTEDKVGSIPEPIPQPAPPTTTAKTVVDMEASVGLDYHFTDADKLTVGYRAEAVSGINDFASGDQTQLVSGPFLKLKAGF